MKNRAARTGLKFVALSTLVVSLVGCGAAPWDVEEEPEPNETEVVTPPVPNDLSSGSTERELVAGSVTSVVNYWSTLSMDRWTAGAVKPVNLSMVTTVTPDDGQKVYLQSASMLAVPANASETFAPLEAQQDNAAVTPGYLVLDPYSYSQSFNVGPVPEEATYVTLQFTFDYLVQTTPKSSEYAKQTATDTVTVAIAPTPATSD